MVGFRWLSAVTAAAIVLQILLGAVVRLTGSGLSCPDWPLCYGLWIPSPAALAAMPDVGYSFGQVMAEWSHRFNAAAVVGPLTLVLLLLAWRRRRQAPALAKMMAAAMVLLLVQAGLGGLTVLDRNSPWSVAVHLAAALLLLAVVLHAHMQARGAAAPRRGNRLAWPAAALALVTVASGAMVAKSGASLACASWPLCDGALIPDLGEPGIALNFGHRLLALACATMVAVLWAVARRDDAGARAPVMRAANMALAVLVAQVLIGAGVIHAFAGDALWPQVAVGVLHQAVGVALFATLVLMPRLAARDG